MRRASIAPSSLVLALLVLTCAANTAKAQEDSAHEHDTLLSMADALKAAVAPGSSSGGDRVVLQGQDMDQAQASSHDPATPAVTSTSLSSDIDVTQLSEGVEMDEEEERIIGILAHHELPYQGTAAVVQRCSAVR